MRKTAFKLIALTLSLTLLFSGCMQGRNQLNEMTILQGIGIDREKEEFRVTLQTFDTAKASSTSELTDSLTTHYSAKGSTIAQALANSQTILDKRIFDAQNRLIVIGEEIAKNTSLTQLLDYFIRYYDANASVEIALAKGKASDIIEADCKKAMIPAKKVQDSIKNGEYNAKSTDVRLYDVINAMKNPTGDVYMPLLHPFKEGEDSNVRVSGTAIFRKDLLAGFLNEDQTNGLLWLNHKAPSGTMVVTTEKQGKISLRVYRMKVRIKGSVKDGHPHFEVTTELKCDISEIENSPAAQLRDDDLPAIQQALEEAVAARIKSAFDVCVYQYKADVFQLAQYLYFSDKDYYHKIENNWRDVLPTSTMHQTVRASVERAGQETVAK